VVVADAESKPSAAREVIAQIKRLTDKPVKYLVITHLHGDPKNSAATYSQSKRRLLTYFFSSHLIATTTPAWNYGA
jgi:UDP-glucose 4-epimerase